MEKEIRESTLARLFPDITKSQIENAVKSVDELQKSVEKLKEVKVSPQEPPKTIQTTRLFLLPPPSPAKSVNQAL